MRRSQSHTKLQGLHNLSSSCPPSPPVSCMKKNRSCESINALPLTAWANTIETTVEYHSFLQTPLHQFSMCMIENNVDVNDIKHIFESSSLNDDAEKIAACMVTPCEYEECSRVSVFNTYSYVCNNQERAGELLSRIRRKKRSNSTG